MSKKVSIIADELFPYYDCSDTQEKHLRMQGIYATVEIPDDQYARWQRVMNEFYEVQDEMGKYYKESS